MPAPTDPIIMIGDQTFFSSEYRQLVDRRIAYYKRMMIKRKLIEGYPRRCLEVALDVLNEQFTGTLIRSVRLTERVTCIIGH